MHIQRLIIATALAGSLAACATHDRQQTMSAVTAPLADLNVLKTEIPPLLLESQTAPYQLPTDTSCSALRQSVADFDAVLGSDPALDEDSLYAKGKSELRSAAFSTLRKTSQGVIPFRGWVRKLSGAERHSKAVQQAIRSGHQRRAFIRGLLVGQGCVNSDISAD